jgi:hypothetical protein
MQVQPKLQRQLVGCGYEPPAAKHLPIVAWAGLGYSGPRPTTCPGYTCNLPEVIEVARARIHWKNGAIAAFVGGHPTDEMMIGIEVLEGSYNELERWCFENPVKKGG